jgi:hypothetical protein
MATRQRKVEKRRLKRRDNRRKQRVAELRHQQRLAGDAFPMRACVANRYWQEDGQASILFARDVGPARVTVAAFLVDTWAMGLKDTWGRTDIAVSEFDDMVSQHKELIELAPLNVGTARHLVYGGIQLAQELGFRLPRNYKRWTAILGPLAEDESPDMSLFLCEGKIRLLCSMRDLEARLVGTTPQEFLRRPDVEYTLGDDGFTLVDEEADACSDALKEVEQAALDQVKQWCFANGEKPHPLLPEVIGAMIEGTMQGLPEDFDPEDEAKYPSEEDRQEIMRRTASFVSASFHHDPAGLDEAMQQFGAFLDSTSSPEDLFGDLGLESGEEPTPSFTP